MNCFKKKLGKNRKESEELTIGSIIQNALAHKKQQKEIIYQLETFLAISK